MTKTRAGKRAATAIARRQLACVRVRHTVEAALQVRVGADRVGQMTCAAMKNMANAGRACMAPLLCESKGVRDDAAAAMNHGGRFGRPLPLGTTAAPNNQWAVLVTPAAMPAAEPPGVNKLRRAFWGAATVFFRVTSLFTLRESVPRCMHSADMDEALPPTREPT